MRVKLFWHLETQEESSHEALSLSAAATNALEITETAPCLWHHTQLALITPLHIQRAL